MREMDDKFATSITKLSSRPFLSILHGTQPMGQSEDVPKQPSIVDSIPRHKRDTRIIGERMGIQTCVLPDDGVLP